jgi:hypothetical protein
MHQRSPGPSSAKFPALSQRVFALSGLLVLSACSAPDDSGNDEERSHSGGVSQSVGGASTVVEASGGGAGESEGASGGGAGESGGTPGIGGDSEWASGGDDGARGEPIGVGGDGARGEPIGVGGDGAGGEPAGIGGSDGVCVTSEIPTEFSETVEATWQEMTGQIEARGEGARPVPASPLNFENTILDQIFEQDGELNYCVRYESDVPISALDRDKMEVALERNLNEWLDQIEGYDCFPYENVPVKIVGWAAMNRDTFDWPDGDHPGVIYIGDDSHEAAPQCAQECGRFFHRDAGFSYPECEGGRSNHYDMSLWLTEGFSGGAGGDWGQRIGRSYFFGAIDQGTLHILSHEMGHGFGFPDYYNWATWFPDLAAPHTIMVAGAASEVTDWDTWMMRKLWSELRIDRNW